MYLRQLQSALDVPSSRLFLGHIIRQITSVLIIGNKKNDEAQEKDESDKQRGSQKK